MLGELELMLGELMPREQKLGELMIHDLMLGEQNRNWFFRRTSFSRNLFDFVQCSQSVIS